MTWKGPRFVRGLSVWSTPKRVIAFRCVLILIEKDTSGPPHKIPCIRSTKPSGGSPTSTVCKEDREATPLKKTTGVLNVCPGMSGVGSRYPNSVQDFDLKFIHFCPERTCRGCAFPSNPIQEASLKIRAGYDIAFQCPYAVPMVLMLTTHP
jgi:hypothetical protein